MIEGSSSEKPRQFLTFLLKSQHYGLPIEVVREINQMSDVAPVPRSAPFVLGVMNLRGKVIPVVDLRVKFGLEQGEVTRNTCIVVIEGELGQIGMVVDAVQEVITLTARQIERPPVLGDESQLSFVQGIGKVEEKVYLLVDMARALSKEQFTRVIDIPSKLVA
jgi:purine-binding chemotaxis protein CheW